MEDKSKRKINDDYELQLIDKDDVKFQFGESAAAISSDHKVMTWAKFVLTDDKPNGNGERVPEEEFDNIIRTGVFKPIKMALGEIKDGHDEAKPIGVITNLIREGNKIIALAALWNHEREDDVADIIDRVRSNRPVNVSWELLHGNSRIVNGVKDLLDLAVRAVTIVGMPAYKGRTPLLAVAAKKWSPAYISKLPDTSFLHIGNDGSRYFAYRDETGKIDPSRFPIILEELSSTPLPVNTLKTVKHQVTKLNAMISSDASIRELLMEEGDFITEEQKLDTKELEEKVSDLTSKLAIATDKLSEKEKELADALSLANTANETVKTLETEIQPLRDFKTESDAAVAQAEKLDAIKAKFASLKITKAEDYFVENKERLLGLDDNGLDFMLQELVSFSDKGNSSAGLKQNTTGVPFIAGETAGYDIVKELRERDSERINKK